MDALIQNVHSILYVFHMWVFIKSFIMELLAFHNVHKMFI